MIVLATLALANLMALLDMFVDVIAVLPQVDVAGTVHRGDTVQEGISHPGVRFGRYELAGFQYSKSARGNR